MEIPSIFQQFVNLDWKIIQRNIDYLNREFPKEIKETTCFLADQSWFLSRDMGFSELLEIHQLVMIKDMKTADTKMYEWWDENYKEVTGHLLTHYQSRGEILAEAIRAHEQGNFNLAVPVFLIQSEGICQDVFHERLFSTDKGIPKIHRKLIKRKRGAISSAFQGTFAVPNAVSAGSEYVHKYPDAINRHEIIHGRSIDYGTKNNSLKAISLLCFCADVLPPRSDD